MVEEERHPWEWPNWSTSMDEEILGILSTELVLTPAVIADNIERSREAVSRRLRKLEQAGYVDKIERGKYEIRDEGKIKLFPGFDERTKEERKEEKEFMEKELKFLKTTGLVSSQYFHTIENAIWDAIEDSDGDISNEELQETAFQRIDEKVKWMDLVKNAEVWGFGVDESFFEKFQ